MTREHRVNIQYFSAIGMLICGVALSVAGFIVPPLGEISNSVLWFAAQTMIYAGSIYGVSVYVNDKLNAITNQLGRGGNNNTVTADNYNLDSDTPQNGLVSVKPSEDAAGMAYLSYARRALVDQKNENTESHNETSDRKANTLLACQSILF